MARYKADPVHSAELNRGAYWSRASRTAAPATRRATFSAPSGRTVTFGGGEAEGWHAPALNAASPAPVPWTADQLFTLPAHRVVDDARRRRRADAAGGRQPRARWPSRT